MLSACHHLQAGILPPKKISLHRHPLGAPIDLDSFRSPGNNGPSNFVNVTLSTDWSLLVFPSLTTLSALVPQRRRWPVAHPVLRGPAVPVSPVSVGMCRLGGVHSRRVSRPNRKIMVGFFSQHKYWKISPTPPRGELHSRVRTPRLLKWNLKTDSRTFICLYKNESWARSSWRLRLLVPRTDQLGVVWSILHSEVVLELHFKMKIHFTTLLIEGSEIFLFQFYGWNWNKALKP